MAASGKTLVIVESATKAKKIQKYLGDNYIVEASVGHIRDFPVALPIFRRSTKMSRGRNWV